MTTAYYSLALGTFFQDWTNTGLITTNGDWSGVPSITGFRGDDLTTGTGTNPTTITTTSAVVDVQANQTNPNTFATGGVAEFHIANPTIALQGSGTADAPYIALYLNASGRENITFSFNLRDIDGSADNAIQQVAVQYRTSESGAWLNVPLGYIADGTIGPSLTQVTPVSVTLPADANNSPTLQIRVMTTNAVGNDEWVGIDDIVVNSTPLVIIPDQPGAFAIADASVAEGNAGTTPVTFTVTREASSNVAASVHYTITLPGGPTGASASDFSSPVLSGDLNFAANEFSKTITLQVVGDTVNEANESFTVTLSAPTNGATLADATATGTIVNDDAFVSAGAPFINEIHYDNVGGDLGEAIEIAGPAGTNLAGWTLVLYNGNGGASYDTKLLSGTVPNQDDGYGTLTFSYPANGVQNGSPDGIALVDPLGHVVQFLSYEGVMTATNGPAAGMTSTDIGVAEEPAVAVGFSLQLTGSGAVYEDFTWTSARDDNFGQVNTGQDFIGGNATGLVSVADASIVEGDSGTSQLIFTVHRAGGLDQAASVDWQLNLTGSADAADLGPGQPLFGHIDFAAGVSSVQIAVAIAGDTVGEGNDTFNLLLVNPIGNIAVTDGSAVGTILNNDPIALTIMQIQSEAHRSTYEGQPVITSGIVTAVTSNGFYLQDPAGDGNSRTSDAIFVLTGSAPTVAVGDGIHVSGTVAEFLPGGDATNLTTTEITSAVVTIDSHGNTLPAATLIGVHGILPPTQAIDDDGLAVFDPANDGIDFYESLEGMLVTIEQPLAISNTTSFGETYVVASGGAGATGVNARGGLTLSAGDYNPERIQLDDSALNPNYHPAHSQGDILSDVTGIMSYSFNSYEVLVTGNVTTINDVTLGQETTSLVGGRDHLTIASYNVENLDIGDGPAKYNVLASNIVYNLAAPDIIGLQEVQDADGPGNGSNLSGVVTAQALIDAIAAIGGPHYVYIEIAPSSAGSTGGEPGGNIRNGYLYNIDRVGYVAGSAQLIEDPAFAGSRRPLIADFTFNGETVRLINVHFTSRLGSDPLWGATQPPGDAGDAARTAQGQAVAAYVNNALATDPSLRLGVLGDFNGFYFEGAVGAIEATGLMTDLHRLNASEERYTYMFDGNAQAIDHQIVSGGLLGGAQYDVVHLNAEFANPSRPTDHDPNLGRFFIEHPNEAPFDLVLDDAEIAENAPGGTLVGTIGADDPDGDTLAYSLVDNAGGRFALDAATGALTITGPLDYETQDSYTIVARATDPDGLAVERTLTINVADVNEAPVDLALDDNQVAENAPAGTLVGTLSADDPEGDTLAYSLLDNAGGRFAVDAATGALTTTTPLNFEAQPSYTIVARATDPDGLAVDRTLIVQVTNVNEAPTAAGDAVAVNEDATTPNLWTSLLANDSDPDAGTTLSILSVNTTGTQGHVLFDAATQSLRYVADADAFDALAPGATASDHFTYTVSDGQGLTSTATVAVTVTGIADGITVFAGNGNDNVNGTAGEDRLDGGNGNDNVFGLDGHDWLTGGNGNDALFGGNGNDRLYGENGNDALDGGAGNDLLAGGNGNDTMTGGSGADLFVFGKGGGNDIVTDYQIGIDKLVLEDGASVKSAKVEDVNHDGIADLSIAFSNGSGNVTLLGISHLSDVTFGAASLALYGAGGGGGPENLSGYHMV